MIYWLGIILSGTIAVGGAFARGAADWPQFRGPTGQGTSTAAGVPVEWGADKNVAWKAPIPGRGWSSPVVADGRVYLTSAVNAGGGAISLHALCIDADTGKGVWDVEVFQPDPGAARAIHSKNSPASATPVVTADRLFVHFGHMGTAALDLSGKIVWRQTGVKYAPIHGNGGSPALIGDMLVFTCDGASNPFLAALDARTGEVKWKTPRNTPARKTFSFSTPLAIEVAGQAQVVSPASGLVGGYDPASGRELWRVRYGEGYSVVPRPVFAHGLLFVSSSFNTPVVYAINPEGAKGDVTATHVAWTTRKGAPDTPSLLAAGDELYSVTDAGVVVCADARTGKLIWSDRLVGGFSASPVYAEGRIYFQSEEGVGYVIKAGKAFELLDANDLGERSLASYAVADWTLFIRTEKNLWKIGGKPAR